MKNKTDQLNKGVKLKALVAETVSEVLHDPDFGKELSEEAKKRLSSVSNKDIDKATPLTEIKKKYL